MLEPMVNEIQAFDLHGIYVGCATYDLAKGGWRVRRMRNESNDFVFDHEFVLHEHEARELLREWGGVKLKESDGRKY